MLAPYYQAEELGERLFQDFMANGNIPHKVDIQIRFKMTRRQLNAIWDITISSFLMAAQAQDSFNKEAGIPTDWHAKALIAAKEALKPARSFL